MYQLSCHLKFVSLLQACKLSLSLFWDKLNQTFSLKTPCNYNNKFLFISWMIQCLIYLSPFTAKSIRNYGV